MALFCTDVTCFHVIMISLDLFCEAVKYYFELKRVYRMQCELVALYSNFTMIYLLYMLLAATRFMLFLPLEVEIRSQMLLK